MLENIFAVVYRWIICRSVGSTNSTSQIQMNNKKNRYDRQIEQLWNNKTIPSRGGQFNLLLLKNTS